MRSYEVDVAEIQCMIMIAARATTAAPTYFPEMKIVRDHCVDDEIRSNNPAGEAVRETRRI